MMKNFPITIDRVILSLFAVLVLPRDSEAADLPSCDETFLLENREYSFGGNLVEEDHHREYGDLCGPGYVKGEIGVRPGSDADRCWVRWKEPDDPSSCRVLMRGRTKGWWGGIECTVWVSRKHECRLEDSVVVAGDVDGQGNDDFVQISDRVVGGTIYRRRVMRIFTQFFEMYPVVEEEFEFDRPVRGVLIGDFKGNGDTRLLAVLEDGTFESFLYMKALGKLVRERNPDIDLGFKYPLPGGPWDGRDFQVVSGNFDEDKALEILLYDSSRGAFVIGKTREGSGFRGFYWSSIESGDLARGELTNRRILSGVLREYLPPRHDLIVLDPDLGRISRYDSVKRDGKNQFVHAFDTLPNVFDDAGGVALASVDGHATKDIVVRDPNTGSLTFFNPWTRTGGFTTKGELTRIPNVSSDTSARVPGRARIWAVSSQQNTNETRDALLIARRGRMNLLRPTQIRSTGRKTYWSVFDTDRFYDKSLPFPGRTVSVEEDSDADGYFSRDGGYTFTRGSRLRPGYHPFDTVPFARWSSTGSKIWDDVDVDCDDNNEHVFPGQTWYLDEDGDKIPGAAETESGTEVLIDSRCELAIGGSFSPNSSGYRFGRHLGEQLDCDDQDGSLLARSTVGRQGQTSGVVACAGAGAELSEKLETERGDMTYDVVVKLPSSIEKPVGVRVAKCEENGANSTRAFELPLACWNIKPLPGYDLDGLDGHQAEVCFRVSDEALRHIDDTVCPPPCDESCPDSCPGDENCSPECSAPCRRDCFTPQECQESCDNTLQISHKPTIGGLLCKHSTGGSSGFRSRGIRLTPSGPPREYNCTADYAIGEQSDDLDEYITRWRQPVSDGKSSEDTEFCLNVSSFSPFYLDVNRVSIDHDHDGFRTNDNCPFVFNIQQEDVDRDGVGDACDAFPTDPLEHVDSDDDGIGDERDNCPTISNIGQQDRDQDGRGDSCDAFPDDPGEQSDEDQDGVGDHSDNCPAEGNPLQQDGDLDGFGDACDLQDNRTGAAQQAPTLPIWGFLLLSSGMVVIRKSPSIA